MPGKSAAALRQSASTNDFSIQLTSTLCRRCLIGALYFNFFCIGLSQIVVSADLAGWAARLSASLTDLGTVIGAFGVGRVPVYALFSLGWLRWRMRTCVAVGGGFQVAYLLLLLSAHSWPVAAIAVAMAGVSSAFFDVGNFPLLCSLFEKKSPALGILTKTAMSLGQMTLPFLLMLGFCAAPQLPFAVTAGILVTGSVLGLVILFASPATAAESAAEGRQSFPWRSTVPFLSYSALSYASFAVVMLWMPFCLQVLSGAGEAASRWSLSAYAAGSILAGPALAFVTNRLAKPRRLLWLLPLAAGFSAGAAALFPTAVVMMTASVLVGATAASGVYQFAVVLLCLRHPDCRQRVTGAYLMSGAAASVILSCGTGWVAQILPEALLPLAALLGVLCALQGWLCSRSMPQECA